MFLIFILSNFLCGVTIGITDLIPTNGIAEATNLTLQTTNLTLQTTNLTLQTTNLTLQTTNVTLQTTNLTLQTTNLTLQTTKLTLEATNLTLEATNATSATTNVTEEVIPCSNTEWQCDDGGCIPGELKCNGVIDCEDASDEHLDICKGIVRPIFGLLLHCSSFWTKGHNDLCPRICCDEPDVCYYALLAENGEPNTCRFPDYPDHGKYTVHTAGSDESDGSNGSDLVVRQGNFWLNYTCDRTYVLVETRRRKCTNGKWNIENATRICSEACAVTGKDKFDFQCPKNGRSDPCGDYVAVGTVMTVAKKQETQNRTQPISIYVLCKDDIDKSFNLSTECVNEIIDLQMNFEKPIMDKITDYETSFNQFKTNASQEFSTLVDNFHDYKELVDGNITMMHRKADECDTALELLIYILSEKQKKNTTP